jgi:hypothetical protein
VCCATVGCRATGSGGTGWRGPPRRVWGAGTGRPLLSVADASCATVGLACTDVIWVVVCPTDVCCVVISGSLANAGTDKAVNVNAMNKAFRP